MVCVCGRYGLIFVGGCESDIFFLGVWRISCDDF